MMKLIIIRSSIIIENALRLLKLKFNLRGLNQFAKVSAMTQRKALQRERERERERESPFVMAIVLKSLWLKII